MPWTSHFTNTDRAGARVWSPSLSIRMPTFLPISRGREACCVTGAASTSSVRSPQLPRKEVLPVVEKHDGLLWYMCPYEGFEANENVIYIGGCPNQHLIPLFDHLVPRFGARPYLVGANYVWGWEMNRLARELVSNAGGAVLGERYLPLDETGVERIIADIEEKRPSFILNNLIGPSSYAFLEAMHALGQRDRAFLPENCPVASCDLQESELDEIAPGAALGQLCAASYFDTLDTEQNREFKGRLAMFKPGIRRVSSIFASAYTAARICIEACREHGADRSGNDQTQGAWWRVAGSFRRHGHRPGHQPRSPSLSFGADQ